MMFLKFGRSLYSFPQRNEIVPEDESASVKTVVVLIGRGLLRRGEVKRKKTNIKTESQKSRLFISISPPYYQVAAERVILSYFSNLSTKIKPPSSRHLGVLRTGVRAKTNVLRCLRGRVALLRS